MVGWLWAKKATISRGNSDPPPPPHVEQDLSSTKMFGIVCSFWNCRYKLASLMASWEIQDGRQKENFIFFQIYEFYSIPAMIYSNVCRFSKECRWFLRKNRNFHGKYPKICKILVILCFHIVIFKGTRWSQNFRESNLFCLQEVSYTKMFDKVCSIWKCQHKLV